MTETRTIDALCVAFVDDYCALGPLTATSIGVANHELGLDPLRTALEGL